MSEGTKRLRHLPSMESLLAGHAQAASVPRELVKARAREVVDLLRREILAGIYEPASKEEALARATAELERRCQEELAMRLRSVWNATGVLLHTNLGRAVLPAEARRALMLASSGYSTLEFDLASGKRISRLGAVRELIPLVTGAEAGFAVNNCAAALYLTMAALAAGREVIVSRGQLVEIGGSFRLPEILEAAGVRLREVGTTNRTRIDDYARAIHEGTGLVLRAHRSNFALVGFAEEPDAAALAALCAEKGVPFVDDLGSGALRAYRDLFPGEPCIEDALEAGADLVCTSGDKLLGIGQAGIIAGRRELVARLQKHPIARVVRLDKTLLAVLESGLRLHLDREAGARGAVPLLRAIDRGAEDVGRACARCAERLRAMLGAGYAIEVVPVRCAVGGGSLPGVEFDSFAIALTHPRVGAEDLAARLRTGAEPVVGRVQADRLLLDPRAIPPEEESAFVEAVAASLAAAAGLPGREGEAE